MRAMPSFKHIMPVRSGSFRIFLVFLALISLGCQITRSEAANSTSTRPEILVITLVDLTTYGHQLAAYDLRDKAQFGNYAFPQEAYLSLFQDLKTTPVDIQLIYMSADPIDGPLIRSRDLGSVVSNNGRKAPIRALGVLMEKFTQMREEMGGDPIAQTGTDVVGTFRVALARVRQLQARDRYQAVCFIVLSDGLIEHDKARGRRFAAWNESEALVSELEAVTNGCPGSVFWIYPAMGFVNEAIAADPACPLGRLAHLSRFLHLGNLTGRERLEFCSEVHR